MIMNDIKLGAVLHKCWMPDKEANKIVGYWAEDLSCYKMEVPVQLRDLIIDMQNGLSNVYQALERARSEALKIERKMKGMFDEDKN